MELKNTFLALSNILQAAQGASAFGSLPPDSQAILKFVAANQVADREICVTDIVRNDALPSAPATKLKRVHQLKKDGWLAFESSAQHHRRIRIRLTNQSIAELNRLSEAMDLHLDRLLKAG